MENEIEINSNRMPSSDIGLCLETNEICEKLKILLSTIIDGKHPFIAFDNYYHDSCKKISVRQIRSQLFRQFIRLSGKDESEIKLYSILIFLLLLRRFEMEKSEVKCEMKYESNNLLSQIKCLHHFFKIVNKLKLSSEFDNGNLIEIIIYLFSTEAELIPKHINREDETVIKLTEFLGKCIGKSYLNHIHIIFLNVNDLRNFLEKIDVFKFWLCILQICRKLHELNIFRVSHILIGVSISVLKHNDNQHLNYRFQLQLIQIIFYTFIQLIQYPYSDVKCDLELLFHEVASKVESRHFNKFTIEKKKIYLNSIQLALKVIENLEGKLIDYKRRRKHRKKTIYSSLYVYRSDSNDTHNDLMDLSIDEPSIFLFYITPKKVKLFDVNNQFEHNFFKKNFNISQKRKILPAEQIIKRIHDQTEIFHRSSFDEKQYRILLNIQGNIFHYLMRLKEHQKAHRLNYQTVLPNLNNYSLNSKDTIIFYDKRFEEQYFKFALNHRRQICVTTKQVIECIILEGKLPSLTLILQLFLNNEYASIELKQLLRLILFYDNFLFLKNYSTAEIIFEEYLTNQFHLRNDESIDQNLFQMLLEIGEMLSKLIFENFIYTWTDSTQFIYFITILPLKVLTKKMGKNDKKYNFTFSSYNEYLLTLPENGLFWNPMKQNFEEIENIHENEKRNYLLKSYYLLREIKKLATKELLCAKKKCRVWDIIEKMKENVHDDLLLNESMKIYFCSKNQYAIAESLTRVIFDDNVDKFDEYLVNCFYLNNSTEIVLKFHIGAEQLIETIENFYKSFNSNSMKNENQFMWNVNQLKELSTKDLLREYKEEFINFILFVDKIIENSTDAIYTLSAYICFRNDNLEENIFQLYMAYILEKWNDQIEKKVPSNFKFVVNGDLLEIVNDCSKITIVKFVKEDEYQNKIERYIRKIVEEMIHRNMIYEAIKFTTNIGYIPDYLFIFILLHRLLDIIDLMEDEQQYDPILDKEQLNLIGQLREMIDISVENTYYDIKLILQHFIENDNFIMKNYFILLLTFCTIKDLTLLQWYELRRLTVYQLICHCTGRSFIVNRLSLENYFSISQQMKNVSEINDECYSYILSTEIASFYQKKFQLNQSNIPLPIRSNLSSYETTFESEYGDTVDRSTEYICIDKCQEDIDELSIRERLENRHLRSLSNYECFADKLFSRVIEFPETEQQLNYSLKLLELVLIVHELASSTRGMKLVLSILFNYINRFSIILSSLKSKKLKIERETLFVKKETLRSSYSAQLSLSSIEYDSHSHWKINHDINFLFYIVEIISMISHHRETVNKIFTTLWKYDLFQSIILTMSAKHDEHIKTIYLEYIEYWLMFEENKVENSKNQLINEYDYILTKAAKYFNREKFTAIQYFKGALHSMKQCYLNYILPIELKVRYIFDNENEYVELLKLVKETVNNKTDCNLRSIYNKYSLLSQRQFCDFQSIFKFFQTNNLIDLLVNANGRLSNIMDKSFQTFIKLEDRKLTDLCSVYMRIIRVQTHLLDEMIRDMNSYKQWKNKEKERINIEEKIYMNGNNLIISIIRPPTEMEDFHRYSCHFYQLISTITTFYEISEDYLLLMNSISNIKQAHEQILNIFQIFPRIMQNVDWKRLVEQLNQSKMNDIRKEDKWNSILFIQFSLNKYLLGIILNNEDLEYVDCSERLKHIYRYHFNKHRTIDNDTIEHICKYYKIIWRILNYYERNLHMNEMDDLEKNIQYFQQQFLLLVLMYSNDGDRIVKIVIENNLENHKTFRDALAKCGNLQIKYFAYRQKKVQLKRSNLSKLLDDSSNHWIYCPSSLSYVMEEVVDQVNESTKDMKVEDNSAVVLREIETKIINDATISEGEKQSPNDPLKDGKTADCKEDDNPVANEKMVRESEKTEMKSEETAINSVEVVDKVENSTDTGENMVKSDQNTNIDIEKLTEIKKESDNIPVTNLTTEQESDIETSINVSEEKPKEKSENLNEDNSIINPTNPSENQTNTISTESKEEQPKIDETSKIEEVTTKTDGEQSNLREKNANRKNDEKTSNRKNNSGNHQKNRSHRFPNNHHHSNSNHGKRSHDSRNSESYRRSLKGKRARSKDDTLLRLLVPSRHAGALIGKGGTNIKRLRSDNNVGVNVPDCKGPERLLTIEGALDDTLKCLGDAYVLLSERELDIVGKKEEEIDHDVRFLLHASQAGCVIGKRGDKIKNLRKSYKIDLRCYAECCPASTDRVVRLQGKLDEIKKCIGEIMESCRLAPPRGPITNYDPFNYNEDFAHLYGGWMTNDHYLVKDVGKSKDPYHHQKNMGQQSLKRNNQNHNFEGNSLNYSCNTNFQSSMYDNNGMRNKSNYDGGDSSKFMSYKNTDTIRSYNNQRNYPFYQQDPTYGGPTASNATTSFGERKRYRPRSPFSDQTYKGESNFNNQPPMQQYHNSIQYNPNSSMSTNRNSTISNVHPYASNKRLRNDSFPQPPSSIPYNRYDGDKLTDPVNPRNTNPNTQNSDNSDRCQFPIYQPYPRMPTNEKSSFTPMKNSYENAPKSLMNGKLWCHREFTYDSRRLTQNEKLVRNAVTIENALAPILLGETGEKLQKVSIETNTKIVLSAYETGNDRIITLIGTDKQIADAQRSLQEIVKKSQMWNS
ncbi:hypothetical protein SNEBB_005996 [Seison nebaliae]|nr:hypothetical protein SNEBB_005996 [Seison nebaliae]